MNQTEQMVDALKQGGAALATAIVDTLALNAIAKSAPYEAAWLWTLKNEDVIFEFENGKMKSPVTWENEKSRHFYRQGDIIWVHSLPQHQAESFYPELKDAESDEPSEVVALLSVLLFLLGREEPKLTFGSRITHIFHTGDGWGTVDFQPVLFLTDAIVPLRSTFRLNREELSVKFIAIREIEKTRAGVELIAGAAAKVARFGLDIFGGAARMAVKKTLKKFAKRELRKRVGRIVARIFKALGRSLVLAIVEFAAVFAREVAEAYLTWKQRVRVFPADLKQPEIVKTAIEKASLAAAAKLISEVLMGRLKPLVKAIDNVLGLNPPIIDRFKRILLELFKDILVKTTQTFTVIVQAVANAAAESLDRQANFDHGKFASVLLTKLKQKFLDLLSPGTLETLQEKLVDEIAGAI
jgi:hypothetical protein